MAVVEQRNKMVTGDKVEVFGPGVEYFDQTISEMYDDKSGEPIEAAPHAQQIIRIKMDRPVKENFMLRKKA